jgi:integrase
MHPRLARQIKMAGIDPLGILLGKSTSRLLGAILLLLVRLGLRAGDVARLRLTDLEWERGTLRVVGKGRYEVRLPLPQDAGDALLEEEAFIEAQLTQSPAKTSGSSSFRRSCEKAISRSIHFNLYVYFSVSGGLPLGR